MLLEAWWEGWWEVWWAGCRGLMVERCGLRSHEANAFIRYEVPLDKLFNVIGITALILYMIINVCLCIHTYIIYIYIYETYIYIYIYMSMCHLIGALKYERGQIWKRVHHSPGPL